MRLTHKVIIFHFRNNAAKIRKTASMSEGPTAPSTPDSIGQRSKEVGGQPEPRDWQPLPAEAPPRHTPYPAAANQGPTPRVLPAENRVASTQTIIEIALEWQLAILLIHGLQYKNMPSWSALMSETGKLWPNYEPKCVNRTLHFADLPAILFARLLFDRWRGQDRSKVMDINDI